MKHLVLIDGHHLMYRAYWAIPRTFKTRAGEQTNTSFGMASMLLNILRAEEPDNLVICFDEGDETFRHTEMETYKDGRAETPDDFYPQLPRVMQLIDTYGMSRVSDRKYEADDFLCAYARAGEQVGMRVTVITGDKDALQLATENIRVAIPHKGYQQTEYLGPKEIEVKYGIRPDQVASYKGLCGDSSDNLPGVLGIGPKTAAKLMQDFGSLEGVYANLGEIKSTVREKLERDREQAFFCERMALLIDDMPLPIALEETQYTNIAAQDLINFFVELEFTMLVRRFQAMLDTPYGATHFIAPDSVETAATISKGEDQMVMF
ncbi:MAG: hypothetical protein O2904_01200 [bacterium]|nr:hypothetical protein [bacterium]